MPTPCTVETIYPETTDDKNCDDWFTGCKYISTEEECRKVADLWKRPWKGSVGTNSTLPKGCISIYNPKSLYDRPVYFNEVKEGMKHKGIQCICKFTNELIATDFHQ